MILHFKDNVKTSVTFAFVHDYFVVKLETN